MSSPSVIAHSKPWIIDADRQAVEAVLHTGMIAEGRLVEQFEQTTAKYVGNGYAIAQSSGTAALILALKTLQIGAGDSVALPSYICRNVFEAILSVGATPQLCDVNNFGVIDSTTIRSVVDDSTKAIIAAHIFGHPCPILELKEYGLPIIEDACQSFGLKLGNSMAGSLGDIGIFSFHATKCLTTGEGGMLVTNNPNYAARAIQIAKVSKMPGARNPFPMSDIQAALGLSQLGRYRDFETRRNELFRIYSEKAQHKGIEVGTPNDCNLPFRFTLRVKSPFEKVQECCEELGVSIRKGVDGLLHRTISLDDARFINSVDLFNTTISVPFRPSLSDLEAEQVVTVFDAIAKCQ